MRWGDDEHTPVLRCRMCDGDGYLDESTLSKPVYCTCPKGDAARAKDSR